MEPASLIVTDVHSRYGRKLLRGIASGRQQNWRMVALPRNEWRVAFIREHGYDGVTEFVLSEIVTIDRPLREQDSQVDSECKCDGVWLLHRDAETAARLMLDGWRFRIRHRGNDANSCRSIEFVAVPPFSASPLAIGGATIVDAESGRVILGGACSASKRCE